MNQVIELRQPEENFSAAYMPDEYFEFKARIHDRLLDMVDLSIIDTLPSKPPGE